MKLLVNFWSWTKNHLEAINFGVVLSIVAFMTWFSVHTLNVETQLRLERDALTRDLVETKQILGDTIKHINNQRTIMTEQQDLINGQNDIMKKMMDRVNYLTALLNGEIT
jgi:hypothetical protein